MKVTPFFKSTLTPKATRYEERSATRDPAWIKWSVIGLSLAFSALFLVMPLILIFAEALNQGISVYWESVTEPAALSALYLTVSVALIAVPLNLVFGVAAAWSITKFDFYGKQLLVT